MEKKGERGKIVNSKGETLHLLYWVGDFVREKRGNFGFRQNEIIVTEFKNGSVALISDKGDFICCCDGEFSLTDENGDIYTFFGYYYDLSKRGNNQFSSLIFYSKENVKITSSSDIRDAKLKEMKDSYSNFIKNIPMKIHTFPRIHMPIPKNIFSAGTNISTDKEKE